MSEHNETELGKVVWYSSDEGSGPDVGISIGLGGDSLLWCGEISKAAWDEAGSDAAELGSDCGEWLVLYGPNGNTVIGKCVPYLGRTMIEALEGVLRARGGK